MIVEPFSHKTLLFLLSYPVRHLHLFTCSENILLLPTNAIPTDSSQIQLPHYSIRLNDLNHVLVSLSGFHALVSLLYPLFSSPSREKITLTLWRRNFLLNFSTPCI